MLEHGNRYIIVARTPRAATLRSRFASADLARFAMKASGESYDAYRTEEILLQSAIDQIKQAVTDLGPTLVVDRSLLPSMPLNSGDLLIAVGQDGLVANTLRYSNQLPIMGVNPDPESYEGTLLPFSIKSALDYLSRPRADHFCEDVTLAEGLFSSGARICAANDIFVGKSDHSSALYKIRHLDVEEQHSSSGVVISTPMGATGWQRSIVEGSQRTIQSLTDQKTQGIRQKTIPKNSNRLRFWVREPWPSLKSSSHLVSGTATEHDPLIVISQMGEGGIVFADGMQADSYSFPAGETLVVRPSATKGKLIKLGKPPLPFVGEAAPTY